MSAHLQQIQAAYDLVQDRVVLVLSSSDFCEFRFWITRHAFLPLWNLLTQLLKKEGGSTQDLEDNQRIADQIQKEKEQRQPTAAKFTQSMTKRPYGDEPILLYKITAVQRQEGNFLLKLEDIKNHSLELLVDRKILIALCQLLRRSIENADWNLNISY